MSKFFYNPTVAINVSPDFSMVVILAPNGDVYKRAFNIKYNVDGFNKLVKEIKKVEMINLKVFNIIFLLYNIIKI